MKKLFTLSVALCLSTAVLAKLPALNDEAKAKAAETAAKTAWSGKVDNYALCKSQDKVAARYAQSAKASGKDVKAAVATPPCADPGPFVYTAAVAAAAPAASAAKPVESAGAHSPTPTAAAPPSGTQPDATANPAKKP
jgi:hypothetical protein